MSDTLMEVRPKAQVGNDPLDIAIVTMQFPAGAETFVSMRVGELLATGHEVRVYSFRPPAENWERLLEERGLSGTPADHNGLWATASGVVAALSRPALLARTLSWLLRTSGRQPEHLVRALALLPYAFNVLARLQTRVPDVVHLEWGHYPSVLVPMLRWSGVRTVISLGLIAYDLRRGFEGTRTAARMADVVRTQTVANVDQVAEYTGLDPADIALVPDGVDTRRNIELSRGVAKVPGRVVVASRLVQHKAVDEALIAFAAAKDADAKARLHVLGSGPEEAALKALAVQLGIDDRVSFLGHISHDEGIRQIAEAEVLLHLSHEDRLPNAVKEAMVCGTVVVTTRTFGIEELIKNGETGYLVEVGDREAASESLRKALERPQAHDAMRDAARELVTSTMDHEAAVAKFVRLWREAIARRAADPTSRTVPVKHGKVT